MTSGHGLTRQGFLGAALAASLGGGATAQSAELHRRPIPASGETLPVIGLGTWRGFDVGPKPAERAPLREVVATLLARGGRVIDSSPMYGHAEGVTGDLVVQVAPRERPFLATKVWTSGHEAGIAQMQRSLRLLRTERLDLMQIHNLLDWRTHLPTLREWKDRGRIRYLGISHYTESAYDAVEAVLKAERWTSCKSTTPWTTGRRRSACCRSRRTWASRFWSTGPSAAAGSCAASRMPRCRITRRRSAAPPGPRSC